MPWPPTLPPTGQTDATSSGAGHHADTLHNRTGQSLQDIVDELVLRTHVTLWAAVGYTATNAPAGGMEPGAVGSDWTGRARMDARRATHFRTWHVMTATVAANGVRFEYSTDVGVTWATLLDVGAGNAVTLSAWTAIPAAAKVNDLTLRVMVYGDGVADPILRRAEVEFGKP